MKAFIITVLLFAKALSISYSFPSFEIKALLQNVCTHYRHLEFNPSIYPLTPLRERLKPQITTSGLRCSKYKRTHCKEIRSSTALSVLGKATYCSEEDGPK